MRSVSPDKGRGLRNPEAEEQVGAREGALVVARLVVSGPASSRCQGCPSRFEGAV